VSDLKSNSSEKKPYHRPTCTPKSVYEVRTLLRKRTLEWESTPVASGAWLETKVQILLVEGFEGNLAFIEPATRTRVLPTEVLLLLKGAGPVEMQLAREQEVTSRHTFLLLDLRHPRQGGRGLLESIGEISTHREFVPLVILVSSMEELNDCNGIEATRCWRLQGAPSAVKLAAALRAFLHMSAILANQSRDERTIFDKFDEYAWRGKTGIE
jgi:hypothetical protein